MMLCPKGDAQARALAQALAGATSVSHSGDTLDLWSGKTRVARLAKFWKRNKSNGALAKRAFWNQGAKSAELRAETRLTHKPGLPRCVRLPGAGARPSSIPHCSDRKDLHAQGLLSATGSSSTKKVSSNAVCENVIFLYSGQKTICYRSTFKKTPVREVHRRSSPRSPELRFWRHHQQPDIPFRCWRMAQDHGNSAHLAGIRAGRNGRHGHGPRPSGTGRRSHQNRRLSAPDRPERAFGVKNPSPSALRNPQNLPTRGINGLPSAQYTDPSSPGGPPRQRTGRRRQVRQVS